MLVSQRDRNMIMNVVSDIIETIDWTEEGLRYVPLSVLVILSSRGFEFQNQVDIRKHIVKEFETDSINIEVKDQVDSFLNSLSDVHNLSEEKFRYIIPCVCRELSSRYCYVPARDPDLWRMIDLWDKEVA